MKRDKNIVAKLTETILELPKIVNFLDFFNKK